MPACCKTVDIRIRAIRDRFYPKTGVYLGAQ